MTLDEAIKHLEESLNDKAHDWGCEKCKKEHEQLLRFLLELKAFRHRAECDAKYVGEKEKEICHLAGKVNAYQEIFKMIIGGDE